MKMEENLYMIMDDTNNIYESSVLPEIPPDLELKLQGRIEEILREFKEIHPEQDIRPQKAAAIGRAVC